MIASTQPPTSRRSVLTERKTDSDPIKDVGEGRVGPDIRRGAADLDGTGEVVSGIVIMREGSNALDVIDRVKRAEGSRAGMPQGVKLCDLRPVGPESASITNARSR